MSSLIFLDTVGQLPFFSVNAEKENSLASLHARMKLPEHAEVAPKMGLIEAHPNGKALLNYIFTYSPFLSQLVLREAAFFIDICTLGPDACFNAIKEIYRIRAVRKQCRDYENTAYS